MNDRMIILGIDPGSRVTGFAVIEKTNKSDGIRATRSLRHISHGIIQLSAQDNFIQRLHELGDNLNEIIRRYRPHVMVVEKIFLGRNADSAFKLGHARGVVCYAGAQNHCQVVEYATRVVKRGITGKGSATKVSVQFWLQKSLNLPIIEPLDASDALALAVYHAGRVESFITKGQKHLLKEKEGQV